jgi:hypothetical protein
MHAPLRASLEARTLKESLDAQYRVVPRPAADYLICVESRSKPNPVDYFGRALSVDVLVDAIKKVRREAQDVLRVDDVEDLMGALSSCLYEDIGWKLDLVKPLKNVAISELKVDIDQVRGLRAFWPDDKLYRTNQVPNTGELGGAGLDVEA